MAKNTLYNTANGVELASFVQKRNKTVVMKTLKCMNPLLLSQLQKNAILYMKFTEKCKRFSPLSEGEMQYAGYSYLKMILCVLMSHPTYCMCEKSCFQ